MSTQAPFAIDPVLTAIVVAYKQGNMIADMVLPRVPVGKMDFKYTKLTKEEPFNLPETQVGRTGKVNEVEFTASEVSASCVDHGLEDVIPNQDTGNAAGSNYDPRGRASEGLMELISLRREKRAADIIFAAAQYPTGNKQTLSGTDQWSDHTNSDPIGDILTAMEACWVTPNKLTVNRAVWRQLRTHPDIIKATNNNSGDTGIAARQAVAELFELDEILVGEAKINSANKGQTASLGELWGKHAALNYVNPSATPESGVSFGYTATYGDRIAMSRQDPDVGLRGGERIKVGESLIELVTASDCGYLFTNAVA